MRCNQGDLARIIKSVDGMSVGKIVQCVRVEGVHSQHGAIWLVRGAQMVSEYGGVGDTVHVPDDWLIPIKPGELDSTTLSKKELSKHE